MKIRAFSEDLDLLRKGQPDETVAVVDQTTGRVILTFTKDAIVLEGNRIILPTLLTIDSDDIAGPRKG